MLDQVFQVFERIPHYDLNIHVTYINLEPIMIKSIIHLFLNSIILTTQRCFSVKTIIVTNFAA